MDAVTSIGGGAAAQTGGGNINPGKADAMQVTEFERLMARDQQVNPQTNAYGFDRYINGTDSPSQWLSDAVSRAGKEISTTYRDGLEHAAMKMEQLDPNDPMMLPQLAQLQMEVHNATFQLQFTTSLVHVANTGMKTLFNLQG